MLDRTLAESTASRERAISADVKRWLVASLVLSSGCSLFMNTTGFQPPEKPRCSGTAAPIADAAVAGVALVGALVVGNLCSGCGGEGSDKKGFKHDLDQAKIGLLVLAASEAVIAIVGQARATRCAEARRAYDDWVRARPPQERLPAPQPAVGDIPSMR